MVSRLPTSHRQAQVEILVTGTVQGVGFRPFVYTLASRFALTGDVANTGTGVLIRARADQDVLDSFVAAIRSQAPPLAIVDDIVVTTAQGVLSPDQFRIITSDNRSLATTAIPADIGLCADCLAELLDKDNRRYHYPFINCTNCGPRYTIIEGLPYDRAKTSMREFPMCAACESEYNDPGNRRFHAQPNACPECGPEITLHDADGNRQNSDDPISDLVAGLALGKIAAIRGLGGFHLAVNACSEKAVARLRRRKQRPDKPFAIMVADIEAARRLCHIDENEERVLRSFEQPIVLLRKKESSPLAENVAPKIAELGLMLPYTPLHHLLFTSPGCPRALVMTSGNRSGMPICTGNSEAVETLGAIADCFLLHNREILTRVDDSLVRVIHKKPALLRRARGYAPAKLQLAMDLPQILACGGGLKSTFSLGRGNAVYPSQHIGDLENAETLAFYQESIDHMQRLYQIKPELVACDLHPDYLSTHHARQTNLPLYPVQHHHAHAVSVMAEHNLSSPVLAIIMDGIGIGTDGRLWGGEILKAGLTDFERLAHLSPLQLPGGDVAAREPWRMAVAALYATFGKQGLHPSSLPTTLQSIPEKQRAVIGALLESGLNAPQTSSCGRLFDAIAGLLGICPKMSYEGQAAMELEALAATAKTSDWISAPAWNCSATDDGGQGPLQIDTGEYIKRVVDRLHNSDDIAVIALEFHHLLVQSVSGLVMRLAEQTGIRQVVLSGGCMQNSLLQEGFFSLLNRGDLEVYTGCALPVNDGAVSVGQAIIGGLQYVSCDSDAGNRGQG
ncbi:MAG: carbamoyltransferase HypF [Desulfobacterales bacterium]|nr:MAG: carbamoyltransferase HypF [Desulfobacterales bacterium]